MRNKLIPLFGVRKGDGHSRSCFSYLNELNFLALNAKPQILRSTCWPLKILIANCIIRCFQCNIIYSLSFGHHWRAIRGIYERTQLLVRRSPSLHRPLSKSHVVYRGAQTKEQYEIAESERGASTFWVSFFYWTHAAQ